MNITLSLSLSVSLTVSLGRQDGGAVTFETVNLGGIIDIPSSTPFSEA